MPPSPSSAELPPGCAGRGVASNQFSVTEYDEAAPEGSMQLPAVWFLYDLSPISVDVRERHPGFLHFLTRVCAVIGGGFAVTGAPCHSNAIKDPHRTPPAHTADKQHKCKPTGMHLLLRCELAAQHATLSPDNRLSCCRHCGPCGAQDCHHAHTVTVAGASRPGCHSADARPAQL